MMHLIYWPATQLFTCFSLKGQKRIVSLCLLFAVSIYVVDFFNLLYSDFKQLSLFVLLVFIYFLSSLSLLYQRLFSDIQALASNHSNHQLNDRLNFPSSKSFQPIIQSLNTQGRQHQRLNHFVASCADETQFTAAELASASKVMSECSEEQYHRLDTAAAAAEQISATMTEIATHIEQTQKIAADAQTECEEGLSCAQHAVEEIKHVFDDVTATEVRLRHLKTRSEEITDITASIEGISQQINLLALNASIEAARAGEAGRGFAVVADEIRKLAQRTNEATHNISGLLESVKEETTLAFSGILKSKDRVNISMQQVAKTQQSLQQIHVGAVQTSEGVIAVSNSINEHLQVSQEMAQSLEMIAQLANRNRKSAEQTQDMVHYLNQLSKKLSGNKITDNTHLINGTKI